MIISVAKILGLRVVAEGVENEAQWRFLRNRVCDEMQGFFVSPPVPPEQLAELLQSDSTNRD